MNKKCSTIAIQCVIGFLLGATPVFAKEQLNPLLLCLAKEEETIHKNHSLGALYQLNQKMVNQVVLANDLLLKPSYLAKVCKSSVFSPSIKFLQLIMLKGKAIYQIPKQVDPNDPIGFQVAMIQELIENAPNLLLDFLSHLQLFTPIAKCLEEEIPEVKTYYERMKYLRGDVAEEKIMHQDDLAENIFKKIINFNLFYKNCQKRKLAEDKKSK